MDSSWCIVNCLDCNSHSCIEKKYYTQPQSLATVYRPTPTHTPKYTQMHTLV